MNIKGVNNSQISKVVSAYKQNTKEPVKQASQVTKVDDKLELSSEAKMLSNTEKVNEIKSKVESGFYNSPSVIEAVATKILNEIG